MHAPPGRDRFCVPQTGLGRYEPFFDASTLSRAANPRSQNTRFWNFSPGSRDYMSEVDDAGLLERARRGDEAAFSELFARHQRAIYRYGAYLCGPGAADDIVQETFLAVLRQRARENTLRGTVAGYLLGIARHLAMKRLGSRAEDETLSDGLASDSPAVLDDLTRVETIDAVRAAVRSLPPAYREVVVLCELDEISYAAAADIVRCPIGTVRSRLHRARTLLTAKLAAISPAARKIRE
jgi:RNA polymerase sigma-70 factor (ECF subfamily)